MVKLFLRSSVLLLLLAGARARATDVDTFGFSGAMFDRQGTLQLAAPGIGGPGAFYAGGGLVYADSPLVVEYEDGTEEQVVASQVSTRLMGGYNLAGRVRFDLEVPIYPSVRLAEPTGNGVEEQSFDRVFGMGNLRLGATMPLIRGESFGLAVAPYLELPTGSAEAYVANGGLGAGLQAALGGGAGALGWAANLGLGLGRASSLDETLSLGNNVNGGAGLHYAINEQVLAGAELTAILPFVDGFDPWNKRDVEGHLYGSWLGEGGLLATLSAGTGLLAGVGAPDFRVALALAYSPVGPADADGDGIVDDDDRCPTDPEDKDNFEDSDGCPDQDNDKDGNLDVDDACPIEPGPRTTQGCPDKDGDTVIDREDQCVNDPGPVELKGCPDRDSDRVPDFRDKCPDEPVDSRADPERSDGCPSKVVLSKAQIVILDKVYFDFNKSIIKPVSYALLDDVAKVINANPQLKLIEVGGHTDDVGSDTFNQKLSQARVDAVLAYLVKKDGVDPSRLVAVGYGETKPISPNTTETGRADNRRVEFNILKQD